MPARWNTRSGLTRPTTSWTAAASTASHCHQRRPGLATRSCVLRDTAWTSAPSSSSRRHRCEPRKPLAPVTSARAALSGLLAESPCWLTTRGGGISERADGHGRGLPLVRLDQILREVREVRHAEVIAHRGAGAG